jgi:NADH-quinone oxidoreductase subunit E
VSTFYDEVQAIKGQYPDWRSAALPALRLAQERHGYLSPEALRECAEALGTTPAFCEAVASFYDMFHLKPVGRHLVEVCTNDDGEVTLRAIECLGGCGWATIVSVDHHYRTHVRPDDVPSILEELRRAE